LLLVEPSGRQDLVALAAVRAVGGLVATSGTPGSEGPVAARLDLRYALRGLARNRAGLLATLVDGTTLTGTIDRVGTDFIEVAEHPVGVPRRDSEVRGVRVVPIGALAVLRTSD
jgi:hypothetical protein